MIGLILVLVFYLCAFGMLIPIARKREGTSLKQIYENPEAVRKSWRFRAPGPLLMIAAWYLVPIVMLIGDVIEFKAPMWLHPEKAAAIEKAAHEAKVQLAEQMGKDIEDIKQNAETQKQGRGWFHLPEEQINKNRDEQIDKTKRKYLRMVDSVVEKAKSDEYQRQFPSQGQSGIQLKSIFMMVWNTTCLLGLVWLVLAYRKNRTRGGFHGFARWSKWSEVVYEKKHRWLIPMWVAYRSTTRDWKLWERWIGQVGLSIFAPPEGDAICTHYLLLGHSGSGKGAAVFSHIMATSNVPVIYQDEKAECPMIDSPKWKNAIRWGCEAEGGWPSMRWNPIEECRRDSDPLNAFLNLATVLIPDADGENAWIPKLARPIVAEMLMAERWKTLGDFADEVKGRAFVEICEAVQMAAGLRASLDGRNVKEYLVTTLFSELEPYRVGWGRQVTSGHDFNLDDLISRGGYILGAETEEQRRSPIRLMWALILRKLMRSNKPRPVTLIMDEAKKAGKIPHMAEALVTLRSRAVSIWSAWQSESLIYSVYGKEEGEAIVDAFGNRVSLLHGISTRDAETLSKASGTWSKRRGGHMSFGLSMSGPSLNGTSGSNDESPIPLITATDILNRSRLLEDRWAIISARGGSKKGNLIIARMIPGESWTRTPSQEEVSRERARIYGTPMLVES